jgi:hypothetical protein
MSNAQAESELLSRAQVQNEPSLACLSEGVAHLSSGSERTIAQEAKAPSLLRLKCNGVLSACTKYSCSDMTHRYLKMDI